jgi:uncharacterized coiled-coil DUF342 family protein
MEDLKLILPSLITIAGCVYAYGRLNQRVTQLEKDAETIKHSHKEDITKLFTKIDELKDIMTSFKIEVEKYMSKDTEQKYTFKNTIARIEADIHELKKDAKEA